MDYKHEHVMHRYLKSYTPPLHGWEAKGSLMCLFQILIASNMECMILVLEDTQTYHRFY